MRGQRPPTVSPPSEYELMESYYEVVRDIRNVFGACIRVQELTQPEPGRLLEVALDPASWEELDTFFPPATSARQHPPRGQVVSWPSRHYSSVMAAIYGAALTLDVNIHTWFEVEKDRPLLEPTEE